MTMQFQATPSPAPRVVRFAQPKAPLTFQIFVFHDVEAAVWMATSPEITGLNIEAETKEEAMQEAEFWAADLLAENKLVPPYSDVRLIFTEQ